jgi:hypothetical protein
MRELGTHRLRPGLRLGGVGLEWDTDRDLLWLGGWQMELLFEMEFPL